MTKRLKIVVIGAQGHFGSKLFSRLKQLNQKAHDVLGTSSRKDTDRLAAQADILVITVKPSEAGKLLESLRPKLKKDVVVISFCAGITIEQINSSSQRTTIRAMADPLWNLGAFIFPETLNPDIKNICLNLCKKTLSYDKDAQIDDFTYRLSYIFVVLLMKISGEINDETKLRYLTEIITQFEINTDFINQLEQKIREANLQLKDIMTKGGVSEGIYLKLQKGSN